LFREREAYLTPAGGDEPGPPFPVAPVENEHFRVLFETQHIPKVVHGFPAERELAAGVQIAGDI
jgi:hypothetical protein